MIVSRKNGNFTKYASRVRSLKEMSLGDKLSELETLFKDLHSAGNQDFIARCNIVREVLRDLFEQKEIPSVESMGHLMFEVCECLPYLSDSGRNAVVLSDVAACITMLSLTNLESQYMEIGEQWEENMSQWVINTFVRGPFKQAKKRAGGAHKCFPVIRAITAALTEWPHGLGVRRSIKLCLKSIIRIIEKDNLVNNAREGYGILCDCISVLSSDIPEDVIGKIASWALDGSKQSSVWETRYYGIKIIKSILQLPFEEGGEIAGFLKSKDRNILQVLKDANSDRNRQVKDLAKEVLDQYNTLRIEKGIVSMTSKDSSTGRKSGTTDNDGSTSARHARKPYKPPKLPFKLPSDVGELPPEFYANIYRGTPTANLDDPCKPNVWDIHACEKHQIWQKEPNFQPEAYDWSAWWWPLPEKLERLARSLKSGAKAIQGQKYVY